MCILNLFLKLLFSRFKASTSCFLCSDKFLSLLLHAQMFSPYPKIKTFFSFLTKRKTSHSSVTKGSLSIMGGKMHIFPHSHLYRDKQKLLNSTCQHTQIDSWYCCRTILDFKKDGSVGWKSHEDSNTVFWNTMCIGNNSHIRNKALFC